jgi:formylglycine-generating enzyme required for sulfatase activity
MSSLIKINTALVKANASIQVANKLLTIANNIPELIPYRKGNKWGFCDRSKKIVIECIYSWVAFFIEEFAAVELNGKYGFINKSGKEVIVPNYDSVKDFSDGTACVKMNGKWHYIDTSGENIFSGAYELADSFTKGVAVVKVNGKHGIINKCGEKLLDCIYDYIDGVSQEISCIKTDGKYGFFNSHNGVFIPCQFEYACSFSEGFAMVKANIEQKTNYWKSLERLGLIDSNSTDKIINFIKRYSQTNSPDNFKCGFINEKGELFIECRYDDAGNFQNGYARVKIQDKWGYIDKTGKQIVPCTYENAYDFSCSYAMIKNNGKYGFINEQGDLKVPCIYEDAESFSAGFARVKIDDKWNFITKKGEELLVEFDFIHDFSDGVAIVELNGMMGSIDNTGNLKIPCIYPELNDFENGLAYATVPYNYDLGYVDKNGNEYWQDGTSMDIANVPLQIVENWKDEIEMVFVEGGTFQMGFAGSKYYNGDFIHRVTLNDFYIGKYEITQAQWKAVMGANPSLQNDSDSPVGRVSWEEVQEFIRRLNAHSGKNYRLPTEAEWEYAARGGNKTRGYKYAGSDNLNDVAWYGKDANFEPQPVGRKQPNELGIYDMSGNVWEWCNDWYDDNYYANSPSLDPKGPSTGEQRVIRGGGWHVNLTNCEVAFRNKRKPDTRYSLIGFRLASST